MKKWSVNVEKYIRAIKWMAKKKNVVTDEHINKTRELAHNQDVKEYLKSIYGEPSKEVRLENKLARKNIKF